ncbi:hypothetical protein OJ253_2199 [Cryptosporidium canis]|uniref:Magnesium transporter n=1 Tax=Cryptosporidium canis TaxID=195482 RepID=A0A9D5HX00_9CRYT|nr:hypothetical protein OJ253_2199 [Cryptosporidium canis]
MNTTKNVLFPCMKKAECNIFCSNEDIMESNISHGYIEIIDKISIFHIPNPNNNQRPKTIFVTRKECCKLLDISIDEYLFINQNLCGLKPIIKCCGKIIIKMSATSVIITCNDVWILNPEHNKSIEIIDKLLEYTGYNISPENNTPSTKVSFADGLSKEFISPLVENLNVNSNSDCSRIYDETDYVLSSSVLSTFTDINSFDHHQDTKVQEPVDCSFSNTPKGRNADIYNYRFISAISKDLYSHSFAAICIEVILEMLNKELIENINHTKSEVTKSCNVLIKSSKWHKYPWRFTFNDFTNKKMISKSVNRLEASISILIDCLTEILEEIKKIKGNDGDKLVICIDEWEDILHQYIPAIHLASKELVEVKSSITFSDELSKVYLDFQRNEYMYTNLKISLLTLSCSITSVVTGIFGMNLLTGIEQDPIAWYVVTFVVVTPIILWGISCWFTGAMCKREINYLDHTHKKK